MKKLIVILAVLAIAVPCFADGSPVSYGLAYTSGGDCINLRTSYRIYERADAKLLGLKLTNVSVHVDGLFAAETSRWGGGVSARAERIGIKALDDIMDIIHLDGLGLGLLFRELPVRIDEADIFLYAVTDI